MANGLKGSLSHIKLYGNLKAAAVIGCGHFSIIIQCISFDLNLTAHYLFKDIVKYTVIIVAIAWILHVLGINLESIIISLGVVGIVIGFASQDIVSNFISGIFVISDKRIKVGEVIEVNGFKGTIKKVGFRNTTMINQDNYEITIPNSVLSKNRVAPRGNPPASPFAVDTISGIMP